MPAEIDHNFSKAHRIVTSSILPLVEQYGQHSRAVWEASKFWKQFFEAAANVSLSGYEELAADEEDATEAETTAGGAEDDEDESTALRDDTSAAYTPRAGDDATTGSRGGRARARAAGGGDESMLGDGEDDGELTGSTPRPPATRTIRTQQQLFADLESPYETMRREMRKGDAGSSADREADGDGADDSDGDSTALLLQHTARLPDMSMTPRSARAPRDASAQPGGERSRDPLLHRVLDKNYRLQATPHKGARRLSPVRRGGGGARDGDEEDGDERRRKKTTAASAWADSPMSSPIMAAPTLRSAAFMSPVKTTARERLAAATAAPRTPGVSVNTPAAGRKTRDVLGTGTGKGLEGDHGGDDTTVEDGGGGRRQKQKYEIDWESDSDEDEGLYGGMSPPKTIQFALPPSKLLQTPGKSRVCT